MFEPGFGLKSRATNFAYKGGVFALVGMCAGLVGTATSNLLLLCRKALDPEFVLQNEPPNVLYNAGTWSLHMGVSSNLRYQVLNGLDMVVQPAVPLPVFQLYSFVIRTANNMVGGVSFVMLAKLFGVQKGGDSAAPAAAPAKKGGKKGNGKK